MILFAQPLLHRRWSLRMRQRTLIRRRRSMIAPDHFRTFAALLLQFQRRLEEVDVEPRGSVGRAITRVERMAFGP